MSKRIPIWVANTVFVSFVVVSILYVTVRTQNQKLKHEYKHLKIAENSSFGSIQELSRIKRQFPIAYECNYVFGLSTGNLFEATEKIPYSIYKKLKLGDSIEIFRKEVSIFGRTSAITTIKGNEETPPFLDNLERFFRIGLVYFLILTGLSLLFRAWGLLSQTYPSR